MGSVVWGGEGYRIDRLISRLEIALNALLRTAAAHRSRREPAPETAGRDRQPDAGPTIRQLLERLASHLEKNSLKDEDVLDHLKIRLARRPESEPELSAALQTLSDQVADFAFREARETLSRMRDMLNPE